MFLKEAPETMSNYYREFFVIIYSFEFSFFFFFLSHTSSLQLLFSLCSSSKAARYLVLKMQLQTQSCHLWTKVVQNGNTFIMNCHPKESYLCLSSWSLRSVLICTRSLEPSKHSISQTVYSASGSSLLPESKGTWCVLFLADTFSP